MFNEIVVANKNYAACAVNKPVGLDKTAINVIRNDCPPFLLPMRLVNVDNQLQLRYEISGGIRLSYMPMKMRKRAFSQLLHQMTTPFMDCADWFLDSHNLYLDRDYILVDQSDYKVKYIYTPLIHSKVHEEDILKFFSELVMEIELEDDPAYIASVMRCMIGKEASLQALVKLLKEQLRDVPVSKPIQKPVEEKKKALDEEKMPQQKKEIQSVQELPADQKFDNNNLMGTIGAGLFGDTKDVKKKTKKENKKETKSKGIFGKLLEGDKKTKKGLPESASDRSAAIEEQAPVLNENSAMIESFNTEIADEEEYDNTELLRLRLENSLVDNVPELMELNMSKGCVVVGRFDKTGKMSADVNFDMSLTFIGRRHVRFEKAGEAFYIIDLESKNHTYLNGEELLPNRRYPVHKGDRITITKKYGITYRVC